MSERGTTLYLGKEADKARQDYGAIKDQGKRKDRSQLKGGLDSDEQLDTQTLGDLKW